MPEDSPDYGKKKEDNDNPGEQKDDLQDDKKEDTPKDSKDSGQDSQNPLEVGKQMAERLDSKIKELTEKESQIDKKINDFKSFLAATKTEGKAFAGQKPKEESPKDYAKKIMQNES